MVACKGDLAERAVDDSVRCGSLSALAPQTLHARMMPLVADCGFDNGWSRCEMSGFQKRFRNPQRCLDDHLRYLAPYEHCISNAIAECDVLLFSF